MDTLSINKRNETSSYYTNLKKYYKNIDAEIINTEIKIKVDGQEELFAKMENDSIYYAGNYELFNENLVDFYIEAKYVFILTGDGINNDKHYNLRKDHIIYKLVYRDKKMLTADFLGEQ